MSERVFDSAQLYVQFSKNRDGSPRDSIYTSEAKDGRVTIPDAPSGKDSQGRTTLFVVDKCDGSDSTIFLEPQSITLIDDSEQVTIRYSGKKVQVLIGGQGGKEGRSVSIDMEGVIVIDNDYGTNTFVSDDKVTVTVEDDKRRLHRSAIIEPKSMCFQDSVTEKLVLMTAGNVFVKSFDDEVADEGEEGRVDGDGFPMF